MDPFFPESEKDQFNRRKKLTLNPEIQKLYSSMLASELAKKSSSGVNTPQPITINSPLGSFLGASKVGFGLSGSSSSSGSSGLNPVLPVESTGPKDKSVQAMTLHPQMIPGLQSLLSQSSLTGFTGLPPLMGLTSFTGLSGLSGSSGSSGS